MPRITSIINAIKAFWQRNVAMGVRPALSRTSTFGGVDGFAFSVASDRTSFKRCHQRVRGDVNIDGDIATVSPKFKGASVRFSISALHM